MKKYNLTIITENQKSLEKGNKVGSLICSILGLTNSFEIAEYNKFPNSYKIDIHGVINNGIESVLESIELTDRICNPWVVNYRRNEKEVELLFNKSELSNYTKHEFNVVKWANFEIDS